MAKANPFRFSTKYQDDETDLLYYGHRYYTAATGRWLSRDPLVERGHRISHGFRRMRAKAALEVEVYGFIGNNALGQIDVLGYSFWDYVPVIGTIRCCLPQKGETIKDYVGVTVNLQKCRKDPELAEQECSDAITTLATGYLKNVYPGITKTIVDVVLSGVGLIPSPGVTQTIGLGLLLDGFVGAACTVDSILDIGSSAKAAKEKQCQCPEE